MKHTNALAHEKSPYLLQHAHNPVDWLPWGDEAFERARAENKPIFLSVGYSTCHWCHVMERESFENEETARQMNERFVCVKVDREERPDVDRLYMTYVQATSGQGGWPMSVFLTPEAKPFFGGTYFPPQDAYGRISFPALLERIGEAWQNDRAKIEQSGDNVLQMLRDYGDAGRTTGEADWETIFETCFAHFEGEFDPQFGGFGDAPKFPRPVTHDFLHRFFARGGDQDAARMSHFSLRAMSTGGMNDQIGGGFHRYSVDEQWIVPHFEKMLYDQAQLVVSLIEMFQMTGDARHAVSARQTLDYVLRDLTHPDGGFFAGEDADSLSAPDADHKIEGAFYVWTVAELQAVLGEDTARVVSAIYGVKPGGNAPRRGDPHGEFRGKNILFEARPVADVAKELGRDEAEVAALLEDAKAKLFAVRETRPRPHRDEKVIVAWNGLMISAFARAGACLDEARYLEAASRAVEFIRRELWDETTATLRRHFKDGASPVAAFADDYAALAGALVDLYGATFDIRHLQWAEQLMATLERDFYDAESGAYFASAPDPRVLVRMKDDYDGAEPSSNSLAALHALRLSNLLDRPALRQKAETTLQAFSGRLSHASHAMPLLLCAAMLSQTSPLHIVIAGPRDHLATRGLLRVVHEAFLPFASVLWTDGSQNWTPLLEGKTPVDGQPAAYVCRDFACRRPVTTVEELKAELAS